MIKYLKTDDAACVGCMTCTAVCSTRYFKDDNPAKSCIQVNPLPAAAASSAASTESAKASTGQGARSAGFHLVVCDQECRKCVAECPTQALTVAKTGVVVMNKSLCVGCLACVAVCPIEAMRFYPGLKHPFKCVACGACAAKCPKAALSIAENEETPASREWAEPLAALTAATTGRAAPREE